MSLKDLRTTNSLTIVHRKETFNSDAKLFSQDEMKTTIKDSAGILKLRSCRCRIMNKLRKLKQKSVLLRTCWL